MSMLRKHMKSAVYSSDVSGAFLNVNSMRLPRKSRARIVPDAILFVIQSWLYDSKTCVAVGSKFSKHMKIHSMV